MLYPIDQRAECVEAVAHESRIFCGLSFDFPLDLSGVAFADAVLILPEHCRKAGPVLYFANVLRSPAYKVLEGGKNNAAPQIAKLGTKTIVNGGYEDE